MKLFNFIITGKEQFIFCSYSENILPVLGLTKNSEFVAIYYYIINLLKD